jgi:type I restriction enzyme S subunit
MNAEALPAGWKLVKFGDVVRNVNENSRDFEGDGIERVVGLDHLDSESLPLRRWDELLDLPDGTSFSRKFKAGQVLFGKRRAYQRKVAVADFDGVCSGDILVFEPGGDDLLPEFLPYVVQSDGFFAQALGTSAGSLSPRTKWSDLAKYEFALPPIDEQRRISKVISAADILVGRDLGIESRLQSLSMALIRSFLFSNSSKVVGFKPLSELLLASFAGAWGSDPGTSELDRIVIRSTEFSNEASPVVRSPAIRSYTQLEIEKYSLQGTDILVERSGGTEDRPVGRVIRGPSQMEAVASNFVHVLRPDESQIPSALLLWTLWYLHRVGATRRFQTASTNMRNLRITAFLAQEIPLLSSSDARYLAQQLESIDQCRNVEVLRSSEALIVRKRLLTNLMVGSHVH